VIVCSFISALCVCVCVRVSLCRHVTRPDQQRALLLPGRVQAPLALGRQGVAEQEAGGHCSRTQAGQQRGSVAASNHTRE